jgi:uncharacterized membrane protein
MAAQVPQQGNRFPKTRVTEHTQVFTQVYQGIVPPPEMLEHFARINASFPDRMLKMAEEEGMARRQKEKSLIRKSYMLDILGYITGVLVVAGVIWLCWEFVKKDFPEEAAWVAGTVMVALAVVFVLKKNPRQ